MSLLLTKIKLFINSNENKIESNFNATGECTIDDMRRSRFLCQKDNVKAFQTGTRTYMTFLTERAIPQMSADNEQNKQHFIKYCSHIQI